MKIVDILYTIANQELEEDMSHDDEFDDLMNNATAKLEAYVEAYPNVHANFPTDVARTVFMEALETRRGVAEDAVRDFLDSLIGEKIAIRYGDDAVTVLKFISLIRNLEAEARTPKPVTEERA